MKEKGIFTHVAKAVAGTLNNVLKAEANSTACGIIYQPKAPKSLKRFKKF